MHNPSMHHIAPAEIITQPILWFIFKGDDILIGDMQSRLPILASTEIAALNLKLQYQNYLGVYSDTHCYVAEAEEAGPLPEHIHFESIRNFYLLLGQEDLFLLTSRAKQILHWDKSTQYCGHCGEKTLHSQKERAKICPKCQSLFFPHIAPVVLARVTRGNEILLARSPHFAPGVYSVFAGFVESGETLEQAAAREVFEEVGIEIQNIQYFASQPWPFPSNIMLAFTATYAGGEIQMDPVEIEDAKWFSVDQLPHLPKTFSISRTLIEDFLRHYSPLKRSAGRRQGGGKCLG